MIGIIQKVLIDLLHDTGGEELVANVLSEAGVPADVTYRIDQNYSDDEFNRLLSASAVITGLSVGELSALYAKAFLNRAKVLFPRFFEMSSSSEEFLMRQATIHAVMASGLKTQDERKAVTDKFSAERIRPGFVRVTYRSANKLKDLYIALAHEVAAIYDEKIQVQCDETGENEYCFELKWQAPFGLKPSDHLADAS
ncbi:MAG: heme NO-binding domain-containing protein [Pseudomonadota bacterium]|nr:heme NO-binding domain-containing protein [Pseudomonadota bacterium]